MGGKNRTNTLRAAEASERADEALRLLRSGLNNTAIAKKMGVTLQTVAKWLDKAIKDMPAEEAAQRRELWGARLEVAMSRVNWLWGKAKLRVEADAEFAVADAAKVIGEHVKVIDRASKFYGLDAPAKAEITTDGVPLDTSARDELNKRISSLLTGQTASSGEASVPSKSDG